MGFWDTNGSLNPAEKTKSIINENTHTHTHTQTHKHIYTRTNRNIYTLTDPKDIIFCLLDFAVLADIRVKLKRSEMRDKYWLENKKMLGNMRVMFISIAACVVGTVLKGLGESLEDF